MLITDTNILLRCSVGRAMRHVEALGSREIPLATTDRHAAEMLDRLIEVFGLSAADAAAEVRGVLTAFEMVAADEYEPFAEAADARLRDGGKSDWPTVAAAMAIDCDIWTEDVDLFGIGIPVWSTANVKFVVSES